MEEISGRAFEEKVSEIRELFESGLYLKAHDVATQSLGPIRSWNGVEAQILGSRLCNQLGAPRLAAGLLYRACRADRLNPVAAYYRAAVLFNTRGPLRAWRFLQHLPELRAGAAETQADLLAMKARAHATFRDFEPAEAALEEAMRLAPNHAWLWCEKAAILRLRDAHEDACEAARQALAMHPFYRPAVQTKAEILQLLRRDEEAVALLEEACKHIESGAVVCQLATLLGELGRHDEALGCWERAVSMHPLAEPPFSSWLSGTLADAFYRAGKWTQAADHARKVKDSAFYADFAARLEQGTASRRVVLPVGFVAQHHMTCAPATLSALCAYWQVPVDHAALAKEICYEGTFDHIERGWAEKKGFLAREFRLTWESACALIERGVPFTLTTVETTSAHLQALIGFDEARRTFILRDPSRRTQVEVGANEFLDRYEAFGPRAMLMLPQGEAHRIEGVELTECGLYDRFYRLQKALERHDRPAAALEFDGMHAEAPGHRLTLCAQWRLASYDANPVREMETAEALLALFPKCPRFLWSKVNLLGRISPGKEHRRFLHQMACRRDADAVFWFEWARELGKDARHARFAGRYLLLALRVQPCEAGFLSELGVALWNGRRFEEATNVYRLAASVGGVDRWGWSYFLACRHTRRTEEALALFRARYVSVGSASAQPARTLFAAFSALDRSDEAFTLLEEALDKRSEDGELLLFAADEYARTGKYERARELLARAEPLSARGAWLRTKANFADYGCDLAEALGAWGQILAQEPLSIDALRAVARLTAEIHGPDAACEFLEKQVEQFPHFVPLAELHVEFLRGKSLEIAEGAIRRALGRDSRNAWLRRELALNLAGQRRFAEASHEADEALRIDPHNAVSNSTRGRVLELEGRLHAAAEAYREALTLSIDHAYAIEGLFRVSPTFEEKQAAIAFVRAELVHQVVFGDGLLAFREEAYAVLEPRELLAALREALSARSDLWQAWIVTINQLVDMGEFDEALSLAREATERFPLVPRAWVELSQVHRARGERADEAAPLRHALALSPAWGFASRLLSDALGRQGALEEARAVLEKAIAAAPLDAWNHGWLAEVNRKLNHRDEALNNLRQAIRLNLDYTWAWESLKEWSLEAGLENLALELARELTRERGGEARSWLRLSSSLPHEDVEEAIQAAERAIALAPRNVDAHDCRAVLLCSVGRFPEAIAACSPAEFAEHRPLPLQGREAWIEAQRGNLVVAGEKMRAVLAASPDYYWGWTQLAEWLTTLGRHAEALEAAKSMARLAPRSAIPLGYIADLQMHLGEKRAAWETLRKAFHLDPGYHYAGARLFDEQLRTGDLKDAAETLALLELHHPGPRTEAARARMLSREGRKAEALQLLRELCFVDEAHSDALGTAARAILDAGWESEARKIYAPVLEDPRANAGVGTLWAEILGGRKYWLLNWGLDKIDPRSPAGRAARITLLEKAAETGRRKFVEKMLRRDGEALRESTRAWGAGSYALVTLQQFDAAVRWLSDWESRADAQPWMLFNLAYALHALGRHREGQAVSLRAITLHGDDTTVRHHLCLAWDDAVRGDFEMAARRLGDLPDKDGAPFFTALRALVNAMVRVAKAAPDERANVYEQERRILRQPQWEALWNDPALRRMAKEGIRKMAATAKKGPFRVGSVFPARRAAGAGGVRLYGVFVAIVLINLIRACATMEPEEKPTPFKPHDDRGTGVNLQEIHDQLERLAAPRN